MPNTPEHPFGNPPEFLKPNIPDCWTPEPVNQVTSETTT